MPPPREAVLQALPLATVPGDPRRLALLADALQDGQERPGQVRALMRSDCGLCRMYWVEIHSGRPLKWLGLVEVLAAQSRAEFRRWVSAVQNRTPTPPPADAARNELKRRHALRRALCGLAVFADPWAAFDPAPDAEPGVAGVRSSYERYLLMLRDRMFVANLGVLPVAEWFRLPVEDIAGLNADGLREALEARWAAMAAHFPALDTEESAWVAAHQAAGDVLPPEGKVKADLTVILRTAGLQTVAAHPLVGA